MADQKLILNVDDDWKRQAQEEKRRLAEQEQKARQVEPAPPAESAATAAGADAESEEGEDASPFAGLVHTLLTQTLVYLGVMGSQRGMPMLNLDAARKSVDMLGSLDEKTRGNLSDSERQMLDTAVYQARNQFVSVASQYIGP